MANEIPQAEYALLVAKAKAYDMMVSRDAIALDLHRTNELLKSTKELIDETVALCDNVEALSKDKVLLDHAYTLKNKILA